MENDKDKKLIYNLLLEEKLDAFLSAIRNQLHVFKVDDLTHVTRKDLSRIGILSGPDIRRFERVVARVTKSAGIKGKFTKVLGKKQKVKESEIPAAVSLWEDFAPVIIKTEDLELNNILGEGNFGQVWKAEWKRRLAGHDCVIPVAVKCLKDDSSNAFIKEVSILSQLDQNHDNIIKLYGLSIHEDLLRMVTEFAEGGSLLDGLRNGEFLSVSLLCQFAVQIASGMTYLEQKGLVHRDLAARNILVTAHNQVKISDFGLAKLVGSDKEWIMTREEVLPIRWLSLESLIEGKFTSASDVWSFGVVLWEMFTFGEHPWKGFKSIEVVEKMRKSERLPEPDYCPSNVYSLVMLRCWNENPEERLNFEEAKSCLVSIHPTSSYATSSQHYLDDLRYNEGDCITAIKPFEGSPDMWIGQNETTFEFGKFMKSNTSPMQCKIPYASTSLISPGNDTPEIAALENGGHERPSSQPVAIPSPGASSAQRRLTSGSSMDEPSQSSKHEQRRDSQIQQSVEHTTRNRKQSSEELSEIEEDESQERRPSSLPLPDKLAAGTFQRYPATLVSPTDSQESSPHTNMTNTERTSPAEQKTPKEYAVRPDKLGAGTLERYPSCYVSMKQDKKDPVEHDSATGALRHEKTSPVEQKSPTERSVRPKVPPRKDKIKPPRQGSKDNERTQSPTEGAIVDDRPTSPNERPPPGKGRSTTVNERKSPPSIPAKVKPALSKERAAQAKDRPSPENKRQSALSDKPAPTNERPAPVKERLNKSESSPPAKERSSPPANEGPVGAKERTISAKRSVHKKRPPTKPPRLFKNFSPSEPFYVNGHLANVKDPSMMTDMNAGATPDELSRFDIDPSAWMRDLDPPDYPTYDTIWTASSAMSRQMSRSEHDVFGAANAAANQTPTAARLNDNKPRPKSAEKKKLRKTQSLESISRFPAQQEIDMPLLQERTRSKSTMQPISDVPQSDSFELESGEEYLFDSSTDSVSYKKLENDEGKKRTLFGLRKKKRSKKDSIKYSVTVESQNEYLKSVSEIFPEFSEPEIYGSLEISRWNVDDAVKFLKVKKLVNLGLCPQSSCLQMLKTYDWNDLEASYAIKIHHVMAMHLELSLEEVAKLLRENNWDVEYVLNLIKMQTFFEDCKLIGFSEAEAEHTLSFLDNSFDDAMCALKVRRVADVTQKPEEYCKKTLVHCQWSVERAIHYIVSC